jgi:hypothetical protein
VVALSSTARHRRLVADRLVVAGDIVCHIDSDGRVSAHELTSFALVGHDGRITYPAIEAKPPTIAP